MRGSPPLLNGPLAPRDALQHPQPVLKPLEGGNIHQVCGGQAMVRDQDGRLVPGHLGENPGGLPLQGRDQLSLHEVILKYHCPAGKVHLHRTPHLTRSFFP